MRIYEFNHYKKYIKNWLRHQPKSGYGEMRRMAEAMQVNATFLSHVFNGDSDLSVEQGLALANYIHLNNSETDYFVLLIQKERAGDKRTKEFFQLKLDNVKKESLHIKERLKLNSQIKEEHYFQFFSHWHYGVVLLLVALKDFQTESALAKHLGISIQQVRQYTDFLIRTGMLEEVDENSGSRLKVKSFELFLGINSSNIRQLHQSYRQKSLQVLDVCDLQESIYYTNPVTLSKEDAKLVAEKIAQFIEDFRKLTVPSSAEALYCLNIDWFKLS